MKYIQDNSIYKTLLPILTLELFLFLFFSCANNKDFLLKNELALNLARSSHTTTLLSSNDLIVISGIEQQSTLNSIERFYVKEGVSRPAGRLIISRYLHTATLLPNGKILIIGGINKLNGKTTFVKTIEEYDPFSEQIKAIGMLETERSGHETVVLPNEKLLIIGGNNLSSLSSAEIFNPRTGKIESVISMHHSRTSFGAVKLDNGDVVVVGGDGSDLSAIEKFDYSLNKFEIIGHLRVGRFIHKIITIGADRILIAGGFDGVRSLSSIEVFDLHQRKSMIVAHMKFARDNLTMTKVAEERVFLAGGADSGVSTDAIEILDLKKFINKARANMKFRKDGHTATLLYGRLLFIVGGYDGVTQSQLNQIEVIDVLAD